MTSANVSNILPQPAMPSQSVGKAEGNEKEFMNLFAQTMDGNAIAPAGNNTQTQATQGLAGTKENKPTDYAKDSSYGKVKMKDTTVSKEEVEEIEKNVEEFTEEVKDILKENLDVTTKDLEEAMEVLGVTFVDLLQPAVTSKLIGEVTQTQDSVSLLLDENVADVLTQITKAADTLLEQTNVSAEQITEVVFGKKEQDALLQEMEIVTPQEADTIDVEAMDLKQTETIEPKAEVIKDVTADDMTGKVPVQQETTGNEIETFPRIKNTESNEKEAVVTVKEGSLTEPAKEVTAKSDNITKDMEPITDKTSATETFVKASDENSNEQTFEQDFSEGGKEDFKGQKTFDGIVVQTEEKSFVEATVKADEPVARPNVNPADIINQIAEAARTTITRTVTSMEIILNPEHLGKIYLQVSQKDGNVKAQIFTQNDAVKEALENQIALLKDSLNQGGTKVQSIEVSVGAHEFEKNLEENMHQQEKEAQQTEEKNAKNKRPRNIDMNNLDDLQGLMTEEEELVAKIMRDNGNTVNFMA